jgi:hypothetical protein
LEVDTMAFQKLCRVDWQSYCERVSRGIGRGQRAELDVVSLGLGDRVEAKWIPVCGLVYEPKTDQLEIALEGIDHRVAHPRQLLVDTSTRGVVAIEILADDDVRHVLKFLVPLSPSRRRRYGYLGRERRPRVA